MVKNLVTPQVKNEMRVLLDRWKKKHAEVTPRSLKGRYTKELGIERLEVVNIGTRCTFKVVRVRKGVVHTAPVSEGRYTPDEEVLEQCAKRFLCFGSFSGRHFARLVVKIDHVAVTLFTKKASMHKNIGISGPNHKEMALETASKFFHMLESIRPPPLDGVRLPLGEDHYRIVGVRAWQTNHMVTMDLGHNLDLSIESVRRDPRIGYSLYDTSIFQVCNLYPPPDLGCSSIGIFDTAKATVMSAQDYWHLVFRWWVNFFKSHTTPKGPPGITKQLERAIMAESWRRERSFKSLTSPTLKKH